MLSFKSAFSLSTFTFIKRLFSSSSYSATYSLWGDATHLLVPNDRDAELIALDQKLFGFQASVAMQRYISQPLTAWMDFAYTFHVLNVPIVGCFVYLRRPRHRFREMMAGVLVVTFI